MLDWVPLAGKNDSIPHLTTFTQWKDILDDERYNYITQPGKFKEFSVKKTVKFCNGIYHKH